MADRSSEHLLQFAAAAQARNLVQVLPKVNYHLRFEKTMPSYS